MNCTKPGLSIICLYLLLFGFNRALVALNNDSRYGQRSICSKFCYGQSSSAPKAKYLRSRTCRFKRRRLIGYILQPSLEEANRHELITCLFQSVMYQSNRSLNTPSPTPVHIPRAFDLFSCLGGMEFDDFSLPGGGAFDHYS